MKFNYIKKAHEVDNIWSFYFKPEFHYKFIEGQFLEMSLNIEKPDERGNNRWFTISSCSKDNLIRITTRKLKESSSYKKALFKLNENQEVECSLPMGDFVLPKDTNIPLIFIAIGIGITPFISILSNKENLLKRNINLLYRVSEDTEYLFQKELQKITINQIKIATNKIDSKEIIKFSEKIDNPLYFIAGPELTMEVLTKDLITQGVSSSHIITDYFTGYNS